MAGVALAALRVGNEVRFPGGFCRFIDVNSGNEQCPFQLLPLIDAEGETHMFGVYRSRSADEIIILLAHRTAKEATFYRTSPRASLVKAVHAGQDGTLEELSSNAVVLRFNREIAFWRSREDQFK